MSDRIDVCNGDADGLCATLQWRLHHGDGDIRLVTGLKRQLDLVRQVQALGAKAGDEVRVFDLALPCNRAAVQDLLEAGVRVVYTDHHHSGGIPRHPLLTAHIDEDPDLCTSLIVDRVLGGSQRGWALVGAYGDNLRDAADKLASASGFTLEERKALRRLGEAINYNAYGEDEADVCIAPAALFERMRPHADPLSFIAREPVAATLACTRDADMQQALRQKPHWQDERAAVFLMPDCAWSRRVSGSFANAVARAEPQRAHAVITPTRGGAHVVSVRAPLTQPAGADALCRDFGGDGRGRAAGVNGLAACDISRFVSAFASVSWGLAR